jgi:hypothetical protein
MMSDVAAKYHALYLANVALAMEMEEKFPTHRGWSCVVRFYAALHLTNAYLIDKPSLRFNPESTDHKERTQAMAQCPELRDAPKKYRLLKDLSEWVRYNVKYVYAAEDCDESIALLTKIVAIVEPKLKRA